MLPTSDADQSQWGTLTRLNEEKFVLFDVEEFVIVVAIVDDDKELLSIDEDNKLLSANKEDKVLSTKEEFAFLLGADKLSTSLFSSSTFRFSTSSSMSTMRTNSFSAS